METLQTTNLSACLNRLQQKLFEAVTLDQDYIPVRGTWNAARSNADFDLDEHVDKFMVGEQKVLLLLGDSGAGKSLFCQQLQQRLLQQYLANSSKQPLPLFISLPSSKDPVHQVIETALQDYGCSAEEIALLKQLQPFIFILDGYDEIRQTKNLYVTNILKDWQVKVIITCRSQYLLTLDYHSPYFMPYEGERPQGELFSEVLAKPFNQNQIDAYLQQYVKHHTTEWQDWKQYQQVIQELPGLKELIQTPFLLRLAVETMPQIVALYEKAGNQSHRQQLTQAKLYDVFVERWFTRQEEKLKASGQLKANETIKPKLWVYAQNLAKAMHQAQVTQITYDGHQDLFAEADNEDFWKQFFAENTETQIIRNGSLLKKVGKHQYAFFHASLIDYFVSTVIYCQEHSISDQSQLISDININPLDEKLKTQQQVQLHQSESGNEQKTTQCENYYTSTNLPIHYHYFKQQLLTKERGMLQFFADRVQEDEQFKQDLFKIVEGSKYDELINIAAANAITVLNKDQVSFGMQDFAGIRIPYADLSYSNCDHTNFKGADLTGVNFTQAWLRKANLSYTQMADVEFGQLPVMQHEYRVTAIAYNPNGKSIVTVNKNKLIVWDVQTQDKLHELHTGEDWLYCVAFSPDGEMVAAGGEGKEIVIWNLLTQEVKRLAQANVINAVAFSPAGNHVVAGGEDGKLVSWDVTNNTIEIISNYPAAINAVAYSQNGIYIAAGCRDEKIYVYDCVNQFCEILQGHERAISALSFSQNQLWLLSGCLAGRVCLWHLADNSKQTFDFPRVSITSLVFSPDNTQLAFNGPQEDIYIYYLATQQTHILTGHLGDINTLTYSPDGKFIVSGGDDATVRVWQTADNHLSLTLQETGQSFKCLTFSPKRNLLASAYSNKTLHILSLATGHLQTLATEAAITAMSFTTDGKNIIAAAERKLYQLNLATGLAKNLDEHPIYEIESVAVSPNGQFVASGSCDLRLLNLASGKVEIFYTDAKSGNTGVDSINSVNFSPDSTWLASSSRMGIIRIWNLKTSLSLLLNGHTDSIRAVTFSPDGQSLATLADDKTIRLWNLNTFQSKVILFESQGGKLSFSPDSRYLLASSKRGILCLWDVPTVRCMGQIQDLPVYIKDIKFLSATPYEFAMGTINSIMFWCLLPINENTPTFTWHLLKSTYKIVFEVAEIERTQIQGLSSRYHELLNKSKATYNLMQNYNYLNQVGVRKKESGQEEEGIKYFAKALELNPKGVSAHYNLGCAKWSLYRYEEAIKHFDKAIDLDPKYLKAYNNRSIAKKDLGFYIQALEDIKIAIKLAPEMPILYLNRADIEEDLERYEEAIQAYDQAIHLCPQGAMYFWKRSYSKSKLGRYEEALADCNKAIELDPKNSSPFNYRGIVYDNMGRYEQAIEDYSKAIELDPKDEKSFYNRGVSKNNLGLYEEAIEDFNKAIELDPKNAVYFRNRGIAKNSLSHYEEAIQDYDKAIALDSNYELAYYNRASANENLYRYEAAIEDYSKAIELNPKDAANFNRRGICNDSLGCYEAAIQDYDKAVELDPKNSIYFNNRGFTKDHLGQYEAAIEDYTKALELDPKNSTAFNNRGLSKDNLGQYEAAIEDYTKALELDPKYSLAFNNRGLCKDNLGQYEAAIKDYEQAILLDSKYAYAYSKQGLAKARLGYCQGSIADSEQALALASNKNDTFIQGRFAIIWALQSEVDKARQHLAEIKAEPKELYLQYYFNGWAELLLHKYQTAITYFDKVLAEKIDLPYYLAASLMLRGKAYAALGNLNQARCDMEAALKLIPNHQEWQRWYQELFNKSAVINNENLFVEDKSSNSKDSSLHNKNIINKINVSYTSFAEIEKLGEYEILTSLSDTADNGRDSMSELNMHEIIQANNTFSMPTKKSKIQTLTTNLSELSNDKKNYTAAIDNKHEDNTPQTIKNTFNFWQKLDEKNKEEDINNEFKNKISNKNIYHHTTEIIYLGEEITYLSLNNSLETISRLDSFQNKFDINNISKNLDNDKKVDYQASSTIDGILIKNTKTSNLQQRLQFWREKESAAQAQVKLPERNKIKSTHQLILNHRY